MIKKTLSEFSKDVIAIVASTSIPVKIHELFEEHGITVKVSKNSYIFREGELAENVFLIVSGAVQIGKEAENGKEITMRICGKLAIIGETMLNFKHLHHTTTAKTMESTTLIGLNAYQFEMLLIENSAAMLEYLRWVQNENLKHQSRIRDLLLNGKKGALYSTLLRLTNTFGIPKEDGSIFIDLSLTNTDIANLCATSRELINRMLNDLKKQGIIQFEKGYITVNNIQFLRSEITCESCLLSICRID